MKNILFGEFQTLHVTKKNTLNGVFKRYFCLLWFRYVNISVFDSFFTLTCQRRIFPLLLHKHYKEASSSISMVSSWVLWILFSAALHQEGLFRINGNVRAVETLKLRLESGDDVDLLSESDSSTVASLLKKYLRDLPGGLVDSAVQQALIQNYRGKTSACRCLYYFWFILRLILLVWQ